MIPQQTAYTRTFNDRVVGQPSDAGQRRLSSRLNNSGAEMPAGVGVYESAEGKVTNPSASTHKLAGVVVNDYSRDPNGLSGNSSAYKSAVMMPLLEEGAIMVVVDQDVAVNDDVFVRYTANGTGKLVVGAFRKDADGVAEVHTITPTAVNSTVYGMTVEYTNALGRLVAKTFLYTSDGSATAAEIVTGFQTAMALDAEFTAAIVATGSTTLILTGQVAGVSFTVTQAGLGAWTEVLTTPAAPHARKVKGAYWVTGGTSAAGLAELHFDRSDEWA